MVTVDADPVININATIDAILWRRVGVGEDRLGGADRDGGDGGAPGTGDRVSPPGHSRVGGEEVCPGAMLLGAVMASTQGREILTAGRSGSAIVAS